MRSKKILSLILVIIECLVFYLIYTAWHLNPPMFRQDLGLYIIYLFVMGHYSIKDSLIWDEIRKVFLATILYMITFAIIMPSTFEGVPRRYLIFLSTIMFFVDLFVSYFLRVVFRSVLSKKTLVVGTSETAYRYGCIVNDNKFAITEVVGFIDLNDPHYFQEQYEMSEELFYNRDAHHVFDYKNFDVVIKENDIDQIVIGEPELSGKDLNTILERSAKLVDSVKYMPEDYNLVNFSSEVQDFDGILLISTSKDTPSVFDRFWKRFFDILISLIGCLITAIMAIFVKISYIRHGDHDPIIFKQKRIGFRGKTITIYKFRTMIPHAEEKLEEMMKVNKDIREEYHKHKKLRYDPRVTPTGKSLRRSSIDEFPQFFNVLKGEMSLVGPRPYLPGEKAEMGDDYDVIIRCKPGITGMWQANGRSDLGFKERMKLDVYYYKNWNLWLDIIVIFKTFQATFTKKGAR